MRRHIARILLLITSLIALSACSVRASEIPYEPVAEQFVPIDIDIGFIVEGSGLYFRTNSKTEFVLDLYTLIPQEMLSNLVGPQGPEGQQGLQGDRGEQGPAGERGQSGSNGGLGP